MTASKDLLTATVYQQCQVPRATLGSPWAAKRVRRVSRGWQTTVAEQAANPPHTKWTPDVWLSYGVVLWTSSVRNSKLANWVAHTHIYTLLKKILGGWLFLFVWAYRPGQPHSKWRGAVQGCGPSRKQRVPPRNGCSGTPEAIPSTFPLASAKTGAQSAATGKTTQTYFSSTAQFPKAVQLLKIWTDFIRHH